MSKKAPEDFAIINRLQEGRYHNKNFKLGGKPVSDLEFEEKIERVHRRCADEISAGKKFQVHRNL